MVAVRVNWVRLGLRLGVGAVLALQLGITWQAYLEFYGLALLLFLTFTLVGILIAFTSSAWGIDVALPLRQQLAAVPHRMSTIVVGQITGYVLSCYWLGWTMQQAAILLVAHLLLTMLLDFMAPTEQDLQRSRAGLHHARETERELIAR